MQVLYRAEAATDLATAHRWYEQQRLGLGDQFKERVQELVSLVLELPEAFPVVHADLRRALLRRFPYAVYYRVLDPERLDIVACLHTRRNPRLLRARR